MTNIVAVFLKTESGDNYLFLEKDIKTPKEMVEKIQEQMDTEFAYVYDWEIEIIGPMEPAKLSIAISNRRDIMLDDEMNGE